MAETPTIKVVAHYAGVSTATVARVIHSSGYVASETRQRVLEAIAETGYQVNSLAQSLKRRRTYVIGHLLKSTLPNPFFVKVARGVEEVAAEKGYTTLTYNVQENSAAEQRGLETFLRWRVDAIIFTTPVDSSNVTLALKSAIPVVQVERPRTADTDFIVVDNYSGARAAIEHLVELGHRRIAYIGPDPQTSSGLLSGYVERERYDAYKKGLERYGIELASGLVGFRNLYGREDMGTQGDGYRFMRALLMHDKPSAVFAASDILAAGVLQALYEHGLTVPGDVSVVGFDDTFAPFLAPLLTTVRLPAHELGRVAAQLVIARLENQGKEIAVQKRKLPAEFVVRNSTGPARA